MPLFDFTNPWALLLLALLWPVRLWHKKSIAGMPLFRRKAVFIIRLIILLSLILALSGFRLKLPRDQVSVLFVVDQSQSVTPSNRQWAIETIKKMLKEKPPEDSAGIILFGRDAFLEESLSKEPQISRFSSITTTTHTDIGRALQLASAVFPESTIKRIVLITDGNENTGNAQDEASLASARGVEILALPYPRSEFSEVLVKRVEGPGNAPLGSPFALKVEVESTVAANGILNIFRNDRLIAREKIELEQGLNLFTISQQLNSPDNYLYRATVETDRDRFPHNNRAETIISVKGKPKILYLASDPRQIEILGKTLASKDFILETGDVSQIPENLGMMASYKAVIFDNINGLNLSPFQMQMIENYVKDAGGGFIMIGGDTSFGAGGYHQSPVERILPVDLDIRKKKNLPSVSLVLCIDKSGSMSSNTGGTEKMSLAREAAIATVQLLQPTDKIGIVAFDSASKWVSHLQYADNKRQIMNDIATIRAGGGTDIYPSLDSAYTALKSSNSIVRHIILLTDGRSAPGDYRGITQKLLKDKITLSTIGVGKDADTPFLEELAKLGQGRFYYADEATLLPRIFVRETILAGRSAIVEEPFHPVSAEQAVFLKGINQEKLPELLGYVVTTPKDRAVTALLTSKKDPLLAYWRTGLGKSVAFTSDDGLRWGKNWLQWPRYTQFWSQTVRWAMSDVTSDKFTITGNLQADGGRIAVDALDERGEPINFLDLSIRIVSPSGKTSEVRLAQKTSGRYEADFIPDEVGTYMIGVVEEIPEGKRAGAIQSFSIPYSPEYGKFDTNGYLLDKISGLTGGGIIQPDSDVFKKTGNIVYYPEPAFKELILLALFLFPLDIALRRVYLPEGIRDRIRNWFKSKTDTGDKEAVAISTMGALKARKEAVKEKFTTDRRDPDSVEKLKSVIKKDGLIKTAPKKDDPKASANLITKAVLPEKTAPRPGPEKTEPKAGAPAADEPDGTLSRLKKVKNKLKK